MTIAFWGAALAWFMFSIGVAVGFALAYFAARDKLTEIRKDREEIARLHEEIDQNIKALQAHAKE